MSSVPDILAGFETQPQRTQMYALATAIRTVHRTQMELKADVAAVKRLLISLLVSLTLTAVTVSLSILIATGKL